MTFEEYKKLAAETGKKNAYKIALNNYYAEESDDGEDYAANYLLTSTDISVLVELLDDGNENARKWVEEENCNLDFDKLARQGHDWAVQEAYDHYEDEDGVDFLLKCADNNSKVALDILEEGFESDGLWESLRYILLKSTTKTARKILIDKMGLFKSFDWLEDKKYIQSDDFAGAVVENMNRVFRSDDDMAWLERCAKRKIPQAHYVMSVLYQGACPDVMPKNESLSKRYLKAAAKGGCELAIKALDEKGISADEKEPQKRNLTTKAKKGDVQAMFELGNVFAFEGNKKNADMWWSKAARKGYMDAVPFRNKSMARKKKKALSILKTLLKIIPIMLIIAGFGASWYFFGFWKSVYTIVCALCALQLLAALVEHLIKDFRNPDSKSEMAVYAKAILIPVAIIGIVFLIARWTGHL